MNDSLQKFSSFWGQGHYREALREVVIFLFAVDSVGSIFLRGGIWFGIAIVIMASTDSFQKYQNSGSVLRTNLGFFLLFLFVGGALMYLLFGFAPFLTTTTASS
ncbi:MAG: hypothetical protein ABI758_06475 [Candidatus Woesebacteria bacterium]